MTHYTSFPGFCASSSRTAPFWRGPRPRTRHRPDPPRSPALAGSRDRSASTTRDGRDAAPGGRRRSGEVCPRIRKFYLSFAASDATPQTSSPRTNPVARCRIVSGSHSRDVSTTAHPKNPTPNKRYFFRTGRDGQRRVPPGRTPLPGVPLPFPPYANVAGSNARKLVCRRFRRERMSPDQKRPTALPPVAS